MRAIKALFSGFWLSLAATTVMAETPLVFAAASLRGALDQVMRAYELETGIAPVVSYAGSSTLARQIALGAPADIYISANAKWMDWLEDHGHVVSATRRDLIGNSLVLIGPAGHQPMPISELPNQLGQSRLAMALVDAVPAGIYGKAALESLGVWDALSSQVAQSDNVRAALALVATGAAPYGIVYASDALADPRVSVLATFPEDSHAPIVYPMALVGDGHADAAALLASLGSTEAKDTFLGQGFTALDPEG